MVVGQVIDKIDSFQRKMLSKVRVGEFHLRDKAHLQKTPVNSTLNAFTL